MLEFNPLVSVFVAGNMNCKSDAKDVTKNGRLPYEQPSSTAPVYLIQSYSVRHQGSDSPLKRIEELTNSLHELITLLEQLTPIDNIRKGHLPTTCIVSKCLP